MGCLWLASVVLFLVACYKTLDYLLRLFSIGRHAERYILITGCDTGFGNATAKRLDALGCHVMAGCLTEAGETELTKSCSTRMCPVHIDVSKPDSVRRAFEIVKAKLPPGKGLWGVLNNAATLGGCGPPEWMTIEDYKTTADVNLYGLINVTMTFLPLVKMTRGRIVNTSSISGRTCTSLNILYCATKFGVEAFTDGLRRSLHPFGVKAVLVEPGRFFTHINSSANVDPLVARSWNQASPEVKAEYGEEYYKSFTSGILDTFDKIASHRVSDVVDAYTHALLDRYPRARYVVGWDARLFWMPLTYLPEWGADALLRAFDAKRPLPASLRK